jgi:hypothetical protein
MKTLEIDSLNPPQTFGEDIADVRQAVCDLGTTSGGSSIRPYWEVAALLVISGVASEVLSPQQIADIENRAMRKLRRNPRVRGLYREVCGRTPAVA